MIIIAIIIAVIIFIIINKEDKKQEQLAKRKAEIDAEWKEIEHQREVNEQKKKRQAKLEENTVEMVELYDGQYGINISKELQQIVTDYLTYLCSTKFIGADINPDEASLPFKFLGMRGFKTNTPALFLDNIIIQLCTPLNFKGNGNKEILSRLLTFPGELYFDDEWRLAEPDIVNILNGIEQPKLDDVNTRFNEFLEKHDVNTLTNYMIHLEVSYSYNDFFIIDEKLVCLNNNPSLTIRIIPNNKLDIKSNEFVDNDSFFLFTEGCRYYFIADNISYSDKFIKSENRKKLEEWDSDSTEAARYIIATNDVNLVNYRISDTKKKLILSSLEHCGIISKTGQLLMNRTDFEIFLSGDGAKTDISENIDTMSGIEFEQYCVRLLIANGFTNVSTTSASNDQGVDILAEKEHVKYAIQCKCYSSQLGNTPIQEVNAGKQFYKANVAVVMTNSSFTSGGKDAATATGVVLWDRDIILQMAEKLN